ncbi:MAG: hypothetical protein LLG06_04530 [Desulfobacteraceae bacterium]|nr:hypothetical protein [Desulfobacteraceae bacterium]
MQNLTSIRDIGRKHGLGILDRAEIFRQTGRFPTLRHAVLLAFFQPSTRTRIGFASAAIRCGGVPIDLSALRFEPGMSKEESISDTVRCATGQVDMMVLRHGDPSAFEAAASAAQCPVVNAGNASGEHPTQALVDLFAIQRGKGDVDGLRIGLAGDLGSRAAHSLFSALEWFDPGEIRLMHPAGKGMPPDLLNGSTNRNVTICPDLNLSDLDVIYIAGLPAGTGEAFLSETERSKWSLSKARMEEARSDALVLCPLPRIDEIHAELDNDPRSCYFRQSDEGLFVRAAVLEWMQSINGG